MQNNDELFKAKILKNDYQFALKSGNVLVAVSKKQEFFNKGYHNILSLESEDNNDNNK